MTKFNSDMEKQCWKTSKTKASREIRQGLSEGERVARRITRGRRDEIYEI